MKHGVVIVAGGTGQRMGSEIPKQYMELDGKPIIIHTLEKFFHFDPYIKVVLVLGAGHLSYWEGISFSDEFGSRVEVVPGGETRYESVISGLKSMEDDLIVGIHDAVRPLVSLKTLERCYAAAEKEDSGIPVLEMDETVRRIGIKGESMHLDRTELRKVQTPQVFKSKMIKEAYRKSFDLAFTDDASVFESLYGKVTLVEGNRENIKITTPTDLHMALALIQSLK